MLGAQKNRHVRPVDVGIEDAGARAQLREGEREVHGAGRLADAPLPRPHRDDVLDPLDLLALRDIAGAGHLRVPFDLRLRRARQRGQCGIDVVVNLVLQGAGRRRQDHPHPDRLRVDQGDILDHLEIHHGPMELGVLDPAQGREDVGFAQLRDSHRH